MSRMSAGSAAERGLSATRFSVDRSAFTACLRAVRGGDLDKLPAAPGELVAEHASEDSPSSVEDASRQSSIRLDHVTNLKLLNHDGAVAISVPVAEDVQKMFTLATHRTVSAHHANLCFLAVLGAFLLSGKVALCASQSSLGGAVESRRLDNATVGVGGYVDDAAVDSDDGRRARKWFNHFYFAQDRREPLISVTFDRARLRLAFELAVDDGANRTDLGEGESVAVDCESFSVRFGESYDISTFTFPARRLRELFEASLPRLIEVGEQLCAHVARYVGEPRKFCAQRSQLEHLIKSGRVDAVLARPRVADEALLVCQVPEEAECVAPSIKLRGLLYRRVDPEAKCLVYDHASEYTLTPSKRKQKRRGFLPALNGGASALEIS